MIKIDLKEIETYRSKCHYCGKNLIGDDNGIKRCEDENCLFRLLKNRIPYRDKKPTKGGGRCCGG